MILVLNLKMNLSKNKIINYENNIKSKNVIVLPQYPYLALFNPDVYALGAQDVSEHIRGSYTGEVCAKCLSDIGCKYCLVCHSEREANFGENLESSRLKINNLIENDIVPIYCINQFDKNEDFIEKLSIINDDIKNIFIAYEPVWLIGKSLNKDDLIYIKENIHKIREELNKRNIDYKLLYGGGVDKNNIELIKNNIDIEGFIISSNVLEVESLNNIYSQLNN